MTTKFPELGAARFGFGARRRSRPCKPRAYLDCRGHESIALGRDQKMPARASERPGRRPGLASLRGGAATEAFGTRGILPGSKNVPALSLTYFLPSFLPYLLPSFLTYLLPYLLPFLLTT